MIMFCLDANIFITAWKKLYPIEVFPSLWDQFVEQKDKIVIIKPIFNELRKGQDELFDWINKQGFSITELSGEMEQLALELESEYETEDISKGAGPVDIKLIAYAKKSEYTVVTFEHQPNPSKKKSTFKIPTICNEQQVECIQLVEFLRRTGIRI